MPSSVFLQLPQSCVDVSGHSLNKSSSQVINSLAELLIQQAKKFVVEEIFQQWLASARS